jgi:hypothetical protein
MSDCVDVETLASWRDMIRRDDDLSPRTKELLEMVGQRNEQRLMEREIRRSLEAKLTPRPPASGRDYHAAGDCVCECGFAYRLHPMDLDELDWAERPYLNVLCNGDRVKL